MVRNKEQLKCIAIVLLLTEGARGNQCCQTVGRKKLKFGVSTLHELGELVWICDDEGAKLGEERTREGWRQVPNVSALVCILGCCHQGGYFSLVW